MTKGIEKIHNLEQAAILIWNTFEGWDLTWTGDGYDHCDAVGKTPKGYTCAMEMKFRNKYYQKKMLEVDKYQRLMAMDVEVRLYFVGDNKGNYMFWLDDIEMPEPDKIWCPTTTLWNNGKKEKLVYLLDEEKAVQVLVY